MAAIATSLPARSRQHSPRPAFRDVQELFDDAVRHHLAGRLDQAIARYRGVLSLKPEHGDAGNNLGIALFAAGRVAEAIGQYQQALAREPGRADSHYNLGIALNAQGRTELAAVHYARDFLQAGLRRGAQ